MLRKSSILDQMLVLSAYRKFSHMGMSSSSSPLIRYFLHESKLRMNHFLVALLVVICSCGSVGAQTYVLHCGSLFDAEHAKVVDEQTVVVRNNRIERVAEGYLEAKDEEIIIDLREELVMPGLIDLHVHLESQSNKDGYINRFRLEKELLALQAYAYGMKTLEAGFTTVRDLGGTGANMAYRDAVERGIVKGPRVYTCRKSLAITGGHADPTNGMKIDLQGDATYQEGVCNGAEECSKAVRWQIKQGADLIKITATGGVLSLAKDGDGPAFSDEELEAIVTTATDRGVHVAAHAHGKEGMLRAVKAGVRSIEHGTYMDEEVMDAMIENGTYYVPTITAGWAVAKNAEIDDYYPEIVRPKARRIGPQIQETFGKAYKYGVPIAFGTDAGVFDHGMNAKEFELMVDAGMPMLEALQSATYTAAHVIEREHELGQIKVEMLADIVAFPREAISDPSQMMQVVFVMKDGVIIVE